MSQNKSSLNAVDKLSGYQGLIVRPLSARLLPATIPEKEAWLDRNKLLDISGRSRKRQMELAEEFNIIDYPSPAGGCLLTEQNFARRLRRFLDIYPQASIESLHILKPGRQFYINETNLLVVGRNHDENEKLAGLALPQDYLLKVADYPGPLGLLRLLSAARDNMDLEQAAAIVARYSDAGNADMARVKVYHQGDEESSQVLEIKPFSPDQMPPTV